MAVKGLKQKVANRECSQTKKETRKAEDKSETEETLKQTINKSTNQPNKNVFEETVNIQAKYFELSAIHGQVSNNSVSWKAGRNNRLVVVSKSPSDAVLLVEIHSSTAMVPQIEQFLG